MTTLDRRLAPAFVVLLAAVSPAGAQDLMHRGFLDLRGVVFPQDAANDSANLDGSLLLREEVFLAPTSWLQLAAGADLRAGTHGQVRHRPRIDIADRTRRRPLVSLRRLAATVYRGPFVVDAGKQFIRWGKADIVTPTDRFAPRDYLNVVDSEFLAVRGVRGVLATASDSIDIAWVPFFTPSRLPLLDRRWRAAADVPSPVVAAEDETRFPAGSQTGLRWNRIGARLEWSLSFFDGFNHLPAIEVHPSGQDGPAALVLVERFAPLRMYGGDLALPTRWFTLKGEAGYFTSSDQESDEYVLYVVQIERQAGEWLFIGGYAGEAVTRPGSALTFAPDRGTARSVLGRASYTIDAARSVAFEGAVRQSGGGAYVKAEVSEARGGHWRWTVSGALIAGRADDFIGQYRRNSHVTASLRYSF